MKEIMPGALKAHDVNIENRSRAVITGVEDVELFDEKKISALTSQGAISLVGSGLHVENLCLKDGQLIVNGKIDLIEYDERAPKGKSAFKRIFR